MSLIRSHCSLESKSRTAANEPYNYVEPRSKWWTRVYWKVRNFAISGANTDFFWNCFKPCSAATCATTTVPTSENNSRYPWSAKTTFAELGSQVGCGLHAQ